MTSETRRILIIWLALLMLLIGRVSFAQTIHHPKTGVELQAAINAAAPGDEIHLTPGTRYVGQFKLPAKLGTVTIRSSATLPGRLITPADAPLLPIIASGVAAYAVDLADSRSWTLDGIAFEPNANGAGAVISIQNGDSIKLDRLLLVVPTTTWQRQFVQGNGTNITLTRSHCQGVWDGSPARQDSQCFVAWNGAGPYTITYNFLEAASENVMFGGADASSEANIPSDILIEGNLFTKDLSWKGQKRGVKNLFELKAAKRVVIRNNVFENNWADAQSGRAIVITPRNQDGKAPWTVIQDVLFERNTVRNVPMAVSVLGYDDLAPSRQTTDIVIRDNDITTNAGMGILAWNEVGRLSIYRNKINLPSSGIPAFYISAEGNISTSTGPRPPQYGVENLIYAENTTNGYIGSPKTNGEAAFKAYTRIYSLVVPVTPPPPPPPPDEDTTAPTIHSFTVTRNAGANYRATTEATDDREVHRVDFYVEDTWAGGATGSSTGDYYTAYIKIPGKGLKSVRVVVYDSTGNKVEQTQTIQR